MGEALIKVDDITFYYPDSAGPALESVSLTINQGEFVGITGPAGAGKTTLSYCLNGIIPHYQTGRIGGRVYLQGVPLGDIPGPQLAATVGSVFQDPEAQITSLSVEEEIAFGLENLGFSRQKMQQLIPEALSAAGISRLRERSTSSLSGGQKQRVVIAAVLAMRPKVLVLDEPTSELDPLGTREIFDTLYALNREHGITIILIEQKIDQLAGYLDRLIVLNKGRLAADGEPREVLAKREILELGIKIPQVAEFALLHSKNLKKVPLTLLEGMEFVQKTYGKGLL